MKNLIIIFAVTLSAFTSKAQNVKDSLIEKEMVSFMITPIVTDMSVEQIMSGVDKQGSPKYVVYPVGEYNKEAKPVKIKNISDFNKKKKDLEAKNFKYMHQVYKFQIFEARSQKSIKDAIVYLERNHFNGKEKNPKKSAFIYYTWKSEGSQVILNVISGSRDF